MTKLFVPRQPRKDGKFKCTFLFTTSGRSANKLLSKEQVEVQIQSAQPNVKEIIFKP